MWAGARIVRCLRGKRAAGYARVWLSFKPAAGAMPWPLPESVKSHRAIVAPMRPEATAVVQLPPQSITNVYSALGLSSSHPVRLAYCNTPVTQQQQQASTPHRCHGGASLRRTAGNIPAPCLSTAAHSTGHDGRHSTCLELNTAASPEAARARKARQVPSPVTSRSPAEALAVYGPAAGREGASSAEDAPIPPHDAS